MRAWLERSFRNRIFLTVLLVALVPLLLCDVLMTQVMIFRSEHTLRTDAQEEMALLTTQLDTLLTDCGDVTRALAGSTVTRSALRRGGSDSRTLYQLLNRSTVALREYADFEVYGEDGDCLYTTANVWPAAQSTGWGILSAARAVDGIVLRAGNSGLAGACPVTARGGAVLGYAVFRMDDANFDAFFAPLLRGADDLLLVDATWRLLYASQPLRADDTLALLRAQLLSGKSLSDGDGERSYYVGACAESGFSLILQQPQTYTAQVVRSIYLVAALMGALCLVLCLVCAWWLSRRLFEPVNELDGAMRRVEGGDYDVRIESTRQDEMGRLAASFDRMTAEYRQNLERSVQRERELDEFLSYIDQPPVLTGELQAVIDKDRQELIGSFCRGCGYCMPCPVGIEINSCARMSLMIRRAPQAAQLTEKAQAMMQKIEDCLHCGKCKSKCPYGLDTPKLLEENYQDYREILAGKII